MFTSSSCPSCTMRDYGAYYYPPLAKYLYNGITVRPKSRLAYASKLQSEEVNVGTW